MPVFVKVNASEDASCVVTQVLQVRLSDEGRSTRCASDIDTKPLHLGAQAFPLLAEFWRQKTVPDIAVFSMFVLEPLGLIEEARGGIADRCETFPEPGYSFGVEHFLPVLIEGLYSILHHFPFWVAFGIGDCCLI